MKKVWQVIFVLMMCAFTSKAEYFDALPADYWVDSVYQRLTIAEQVGQLIDLRVAPTNNNIDEIESIIIKYNIGAITISGGDADATIRLIQKLREKEFVPIYISSENDQSLKLPFNQAMPVPDPGTFNMAGDQGLLENTMGILAEIYKDFGINCHSYNPLRASFSEEGFFVEDNSGFGNDLFKRMPQHYANYNMGFITDMQFALSDNFAFSPREMDSWSNSEWQDLISTNSPDWDLINSSISIINIKSLPDFPENEAHHFFKKVINPLFWKQLQFAGILSVDYNSIIQNPLQSQDQATVRKIFKIGADKIITSNDVDLVHSSLMSAVEERYIRKNEIKEKVKRNLRFKYECGLNKSEHHLVYPDHISMRLNEPELLKNNFLVYSKALDYHHAEDGILPIMDVGNSSFASLTIGYTEQKVFQETLEKYAPFVHYMIPDPSFNPYDLEIIADQLKHFDQIIIGLHTNDLISFNPNVIDFLVELKSSSNVVLVFFGNEVNELELQGFNNKIVMHEDNDFTQRIAACKIFGADEKSTGRLTYSVPEMEGMDSRTLEKIDEIVNEAISIGATPGCQVLVARKGSVILDKGFGYYTYDSIMPVDTRTIYDLASITKVAATTQAMMKLIEDGKIDLDSTLGVYLPELKETNKEPLIVRDVLAHQSGLRSFYPFWRYTIEDNEQTLQYYKRFPDPEYSNTVAYGMFAGDDLKDSLWHWTIDTKLRRKKYGVMPYDYKYSDLGFYLLQMLVERSSGIPLDHYMDSLFYKPMGLATMTYNPLCKFQLKRITPTENDKDFRHVLVWGTVHDQIAAMKGGVSGHAGLFSNAHDVAKILQMQLQGGSYGGMNYLDAQTIDSFTSYYSSESRRGLGWDKPEKRDDEYNPVSRYASHKSFGHSGFTGTIAWADPAFDLIFVFLSNRIYPDMDNGKLIDFNIRKRIQDVVYESIWNFEKRYN